MLGIGSLPAIMIGAVVLFSGGATAWAQSDDAQARTLPVVWSLTVRR
jgi:hypothetical protein